MITRIKNGLRGLYKIMKEKIKKLNLIGEDCPLTFVKTKLKLETMKKGTILRIKGDSIRTFNSLPNQLKIYNYQILKIKQHKKFWELEIMV